MSKVCQEMTQTNNICFVFIKTKICSPFNVKMEEYLSITNKNEALFQKIFPRGFLIDTLYLYTLFLKYPIHYPYSSSPNRSAG